jgi:hypothetical protein
MSSRRDASRAAIAAVARALGDERERVMFVGGTTVALYELEGSADVRPTVDVDAVVDVATTAEYYAFVSRLRRRGFRECTDEGAPLCRLLCGNDVRVDLVATSDTAIGPTNRWYGAAVAAAQRFALDEDLSVRAIGPLHFVATKLEAFRGRGHGDHQASHDLEDILAVLAGLAPLRRAIERDESEVGRFVRDSIRDLAREEAFIDAVPGHFDGDAAGQARADAVLGWLAVLRT